VALGADDLALEAPLRRPRITAALPIGTQASFIAAARRAAALGHPLDALLTVRWSSLPEETPAAGTGRSEAVADHALRRPDPGPVPRIRRLVETIRHWLARRGCPALYIWVRESVRGEGEHWHLALHLPEHLHDAFGPYLASRLGEPIGPARSHARGRTDGELFQGERGGWHLARDTRPEERGGWLAAYLGKGEPSQVPFRGRVRPNRRKPVRGRAHGGTIPGDGYDAPQ
jgi:hypothetical protein